MQGLWCIYSLHLSELLKEALAKLEDLHLCVAVYYSPTHSNMSSPTPPTPAPPLAGPVAEPHPLTTLPLGPETTPSGVVTGANMRPTPETPKSGKRKAAELTRGWKKARVGSWTAGALLVKAFENEDPQAVQLWRAGVTPVGIEEEKDHARYGALDRRVAMELKRLKAADAAEDAAVAAIAATEKAATAIQALGYQVRAEPAEPDEVVHRLGVPREEYQWDQDKVKGAVEEALDFFRWHGPYPEDAWFHEVTGEAALKKALKKLEQVGLSLNQVGGSDGYMSHDIVPYGEDWRYVRSIYIIIYQDDVDEDPVKVKKAVYKALPKDRPFDRSVVDEENFTSCSHVWRIESCVEELPLLEAVGLGADEGMRLNGIPTYCAYPLDEEDDRYAKYIRLSLPADAEDYEVDKAKVKLVVEKALGMTDWKIAHGYEYLECRLDKAKEALVPLDLEPDEVDDDYYWIAACEDDERYMLNPPVDSSE